MIKTNLDKRRKRTGLLGFILTLIVASAMSAQELPKNLKLAGVEYQGLSHLTPGDITALSGLNIGQSVTASDLQNAASQLSFLGYFKSVRFEYRYQGAQLTVTYHVEEKADLVDCLFDNFVGLNENELLGVIQRKIPSFRGKAPLSGTILKTLSEILAKYLSHDGIAYQVSSTPLLGSSAEPKSFIVFSITEPQTPVCKVTFEGDSADMIPELEAVARKLIKSPYSRSQIDVFKKLQIIPLMRRNGYWNSDIKSIASERMNTPDCVNGALAKISFSFGEKYYWGGVSWSGNAIKTTSDLDLLLGMKSGDIAGQEKIETGMIQVSSSYLKNGYADYRLVSADPILDKNSRRIDYKVQIKEGKQYRMGRFARATNADASLPFEKLSKQWRLKTGEIFDALYLDEFIEKYFKPWLQAYAPDSRLALGAFPDKTETNSMNVLLFLLPPER
jgi:outer membrane protein insertion porin family